MIDTTRFRIEPRADYMFGHDKWLVVYDKQADRYLTEPGSRGYARFNDSDEIGEFLHRHREELYG